MLGCILLQIAGRTFFRVPFSWTDELARFTFLWFCFLGSVMTLRYRLHLGIDYVEGKMGPKAKYVNRAFVYVLIVAFGLLVGVLGSGLVGIVGTQVSPVMRLPMRCIYFVVPLAGFLYALFALFELKCHFFGGEALREAPQTDVSLEEVEL
jgi:TRAP-type C4-dicarboxylate transport system permease small subunit